MSYLANFGKVGRVLAAIATTTLFAACAVAPVQDADRNADSRAVQEIRVRLSQIVRAAEEKDFRRLDSYHLYGPRFSKFSGPTFVRQDATAARAGEHAGLSAINDLRMRTTHLKIDLFSRTAVATFVLEFSFRAGETRLRKQERATLVFVKQRGEWLIAHEHLSTPAS